METENAVKTPEKLVYVADPIKACPECQGGMHWCSAEKTSGRTMEGNLYKGCAGRGTRGHPANGDAWICQFCDVIYPV